RLNAAGRIGDARDGLRLLLTDDPTEAAGIARELETLNARRQALDQRILDEAIELAERTLRPEDYALVLAAEGWHPGVIGIVASRLVERYGRPTFLVAWEETGGGRGSGRSVAGFEVRGARAVAARRVGANHLRFLLDDGSGVLPAIGFQWADAVPDAWLAQPLDVAFRLERDEWQGRANLQARIASIAPSE